MPKEKRGKLKKPKAIRKRYDEEQLRLLKSLRYQMTLSYFFNYIKNIRNVSREICLCVTILMPVGGRGGEAFT